MSNVVKKCGCGRSYTAAEWERLEGRELWPLLRGQVYRLEQARCCQCGSHITRRVQP